MRDRLGIDLTKNDEVILLQVTASMVSGLPAEEAKFLLSMQGKTVAVSDIDEARIEVSMPDPTSGMIHFLRVAGTDVKKN